jgi:methionine-S-sulfoxide reductase
MRPRAAKARPQAGARGREGMRRALLAAGCFWGVEAAFRQVAGVVDTRVGFAGGHVPEPTYEQVATGTTGHVHTVRIDFDPGRIGYAALLGVFWSIHDPTQLDRQGSDIGPQYRSAIFHEDDQQREVALASLAAERPRRTAPIVTRILPAGPFHPAEETHQRYYEKRGMMAWSLLRGPGPCP